MLSPKGIGTVRGARVRPRGKTGEWDCGIISGLSGRVTLPGRAADVRPRDKSKNFDDANIILVEQKPEVLQAFRHGLREWGFHNIVSSDKLSELEDRSAEKLIDLMICDVDGQNEGFSAFNKLIRQGGHGPNPYVVTIGITEVPTEENIKRVIEAGVDSILLKPLSINALVDRISALVSMRKAFVVSTGYIGPDRRLRPRQETCLPLVGVPNTLQERFEGTFDEARILEAIENTNQQINVQRATQDAVLIDQIVRQIVPCYDLGRVDDSILVHLHHLQRTVLDISRRMEKAGDAAVGDLCSALLPIVQKIIASHLTPDTKDLRLLQDVATAIFMAYGTEEKIAALSSDIARTIKRTGRYSEDESS